jgi:streptogramin lyase
MCRRFLFGALTLAVLSACGGGGGGSTGSGMPPVQSGPTPGPAPTSSPAPYATLAPPSSRQGDVKTLAVGGGGTAIAYWPDHSVLAVAQGGAVVDAADGTVLAGTVNGTPITALTYSSSSHAIVFATSNAIFSAVAPNQASLTLASGLTNVESVASASDGTIYAIDTDHVVSIKGGIVSNVTAPGTIGSRSWNATPSIIVASDGTLFVSDPTNDVVSHVTASGAITPFAGGCKAWRGGGAGMCWPVSMPGTGSSANFGTPGALAYNAAIGTLYVADAEDNQVWAISATGAAAPVAGYGAAQNVDGNGFAAFLNAPSSLAFQSANGSVDILEAAPNGQQEIAAFSTTGTAPPAQTNPAVAIFSPQGLTLDDLAASPDGGAWTAETGNIDRVSPTGVITKYAPPSGVFPTWHVAVDANGNAWYLAQRFSNMVIVDAGVLEITPGGAQTYRAVQPQRSTSPVTMESIAIGPDGNPWFTESESSLHGGSFGFINASTQTMSQFAIANVPGSISQGPGGTIAYGNYVPGGQELVSVASLNGTTTASYPIDLIGSNSLQYRAVDTTMWFTDSASTISKFSSSGAETDYSVCSNCGPVNLTIAPDGSVWSDEGNGPTSIIRVTPSGQILRYPLPTTGPTYGISARPDGKLWVYNNIGVLFLFDPAAYDAMNGPHVSQTKAPSSNASVRSRWHTAGRTQ